MIEAYLDESGIHGGSNTHPEAPVCVVAGYFAKAREWRKFEKNWNKVLHSHLVPLHEFHAKELFNKRGFFHRWSRQTHERFVTDILDTIFSPGYKLYPVSSGIIVADFESFIDAPQGS